ncbi:MAG: sporulation protein YqfD, partial [Clostridia bacterium]|nr:sporulation protein YqfD [Clostridia bacterium]
LMIFSTYFTWNIRVYGAEGELNAEVVSVLKQNNIAVGKRLPNNTSVIENILLEQLPNIAQVSCIKRGTTLIINISKKLVYTPESYEPIRAKFNGVVSNFSLVSGTMAVSLGDFVSKGDILVYPFILDKEGKQVSVNPIAEVRARAYVVGSSKLNATSTELARTGRTYTTSCMQLLNKKLFSKKLPKPFALYETNVYNQYISSVLPIVKTTITYYELDYVVVNYDIMAETARIEQESVDLAYKNLPSNSEIIDQQTTSLIVNDCLYSTTTLTISTIIS